MKSLRFRPLQHRHVCCQCERRASWYYVPTRSNDDQLTHYFCEGCVPRGCECQLDSKTQELGVDAQGRQLPCIEFDWSRNGFSTLPDQPSKWKHSKLRYEKRSYRGFLRRWLKDQDPKRRPLLKKRMRNDMVATRLLKKIYPILQRLEALHEG